jgi:hypothetical protein
MIINKKKQHVSKQPILNKQSLEQVANYKYLGALINEELDSNGQKNAKNKKTTYSSSKHSNRKDSKKKYLLIST